MNEMSVPQRRRHVRAAPHLRVPFGHRLDDGAPVVWNSKQAINGHMLISGPSGTGKTFQLNRLIACLAQQGVSRIHVLNVHGDLCDGMPEDQVHTVHFSEQSPYGLQPLELLDDPDLGGVRRRALAFIALMARQGALGQRQRPALFRLLVEGYRRFGFYADVPTTWGLGHDPRNRPGAAKRYPTLRDLKDSVWRRLVMMKMGQTQTTTVALEKVVTLAKRRAQLRKRLKTVEGEEHDKIEAALVKARSEAGEAFAEGLEQIDTGTELEEFILMVKETRKFGVGMVLAGQSFEHFSNDLLTSASVRLVLGCPEMFLEQTRRRLGLPLVEQDKRKIIR